MVAPLNIDHPDIFGAYRDGVEFRDQRKAQKRADAARAGLGSYLSAGDRAGLDQAYRNDPDAAFKAQQAVQKQQGDAQTVAANFAKAWSAAPPQAKPNLISAARRTIAQRPDLQQVLGDQLPQTDDPAEWDNFLGQGALFDGGGVGGTVQSTFVDDQGNRVAIMRDGSKQIIGANAPNNQIMEAAGGIYGINKGNLQAAPVMLGGAPQPQAQPTAIDTSIDINSLPPGEREAAMMAAQGQDAHVVNGVAVPGNTLEAQQMGARGPQQAMPQAPAGRQLQAAPKAAPAESAMRERITLAKQMGATDAEIAAMVTGKNVAKDQAPMPVGALKMAQASKEKAQTAKTIISSISKHLQRMEAGKLSFGPAQNLVYRAMNAAGKSSEESRNYQEFVSDLEKLRNDSLRLNAGVQTDGDAQRAWNELFANINDTAFVKQRLATINDLNERAAMLHETNAEETYGNYGRGPDGKPAGQAPAAAGGGWSATRVK